MISITPTKLTDYLTCPYKYKLKHIEKIGESTSSAALSFGISLHSALEELHRRDDNVVFAASNALSVSELLDRHWDKGGYADGDEEANYYAKGYRTLENYRASLFDSKEETIGVEVFMSYIINLGGVSFRLGCKADRVSVRPDGILEIIDYKTSASGKVPTAEFLRRDLPTFLYYALARLTYPEYKIAQVSFLNLTTLAKSTACYDTETVVSNKQALIAALKSVAAVEHKPRPSEHCSWCIFEDSCPAANKVADFASLT